MDDLANYIPARLSGIFLIGASALLRLDWRNAWRTMRRDAHNCAAAMGHEHIVGHEDGHALAVQGVLHIRPGEDALFLRGFVREPRTIVLHFNLQSVTAVAVGIFEEVSARYETPFILLCALTLTIGIFGYQLSLHKNFLGLGWLILLVAVVEMWMLASHANQNYWEMVSAFGYGCAPNMPDCATMPDNATPWWVLFFRL